MVNKSINDDKKSLLRAQETLSKTKQSIAVLSKIVGKDFSRALSLLKNRQGKIIVSGVGKSGFIAGKIAATLTSLGHQAFYLNPQDALHGDIGIISSGDVIIAMSYSGESAELLKVIRHSKAEFSILVISFTGNRNSTLSKLSDVILSYSINKEGSPLGLAPMASTTTALVLGDMLASALTSPHSFKEKHFAKFHPAGYLGLNFISVSKVMKKGKDLPHISEKVTFVRALEEVTRKRMGVVAITNVTGKLRGVITDGDIRRIILSNKDPKKENVTNLMNRKPKYIRETNTLKDALDIMEQYKITNLFVLGKRNILVGIIHIHDIVSRL